MIGLERSLKLVKFVPFPQSLLKQPIPSFRIRLCFVNKGDGSICMLLNG